MNDWQPILAAAAVVSFVAAIDRAAGLALATVFTAIMALARPFPGAFVGIDGPRSQGLWLITALLLSAILLREGLRIMGRC